MNPIEQTIKDAFYRFPRQSGLPTRLHVSTEVCDQLWDIAENNGGEIAGTLRFLGCPVVEIPDLDGFRWIRERPYAWDCGPVVMP